MIAVVGNDGNFIDGPSPGSRITLSRRRTPLATAAQLTAAAILCLGASACSDAAEPSSPSPTPGPSVTSPATSPAHSATSPARSPRSGESFDWTSLLDRAAGMDDGAVATVDPSPVDVTGRRFQTKCVGHGEPTVVLVSGLGVTMDTWIHVQGKIGSVTRICAYDRLGIGDSGPLPRRQTFRTFSDDLDGLLDALKVRRPVVVVGHSLGGPIAMAWATSHPDDVAGVVLVDPASASFEAWGEKHWTAEAAAQYGPWTQPLAKDAEHVDYAASWAALADLPRIADVPMVVVTHDPGHPDTVEAAMLGVDPAETTKEWLAGEHAWAALSDDAEVVTAEGAGHLIEEDTPDAVVAAILHVLDEHGH